jgi:hypothetical protein
MVTKWMALLGCVVFGQTLEGCHGPPSVEIVNMSGMTYSVAIFAARDDYRIDTIPAGSSRCWIVPEVARGELVKIGVAKPTPEIGLSNGYSLAWFDSLTLDRSWRVQIHSAKAVDASTSWNDARRIKEAQVDDWFNRATAAYIRGTSHFTVSQLEALRIHQLDGGPILPGAPHYEIAAEIHAADRCSTSEH